MMVKFPTQDFAMSVIHSVNMLYTLVDYQVNIHWMQSSQIWDAT